MARKKQEIQLQREIETQEEWEEVMAMEGLWVVDVYQEWCGPCLALVAMITRSYFEGWNSDILHTWSECTKVQRVITEQLAYEHKVLEGAAERKK
ncbi:Thioredoxin domain-containing protein 3 [Bulinus truncatus]|nr:Thioredoxin domain-containing protein 3 [Bulinus truncatus]